MKDLLIKYLYHVRVIKQVKRLNDCNGAGTHNHLVCKRRLIHLAKLDGQFG